MSKSRTRRSRERASPVAYPVSWMCLCGPSGRSWPAASRPPARPAQRPRLHYPLGEAGRPRAGDLPRARPQVRSRSRKEEAEAPRPTSGRPRRPTGSYYDGIRTWTCTPHANSPGADLQFTLSQDIRAGPQRRAGQALGAREGALRLPALAVDPLEEPPLHLPAVAALGPPAAPIPPVQRDDRGADARVLAAEAVAISDR
jgi:hypothetical protein